MQPRNAGPLSLDDTLRSALAELRYLENQDALPELDLEAVRDAERAVELRLPDEVLACFAAATPSLLDARKMGVEHVVGLTGRCRALGARGDLVAVAVDPGPRFLCLSKAGTGLVVFDAETREATASSLESWLGAVLDEVRAARAEVPPYDRALTPTFVPRIARALPESAQGRRVRHPSFGEGRVLREVPGGKEPKVQVDFPARGLKLVLVRFLEYLE